MSAKTFRETLGSFPYRWSTDPADYSHYPESQQTEASELPRVLEINGVFYEARETSDALASLLAEARNKVEFVQAVLASAIEYAQANPDKLVGLSPTVLADIGKTLGPKLPGVLHDIDAPRRERLRDAEISANGETGQSADKYGNRDGELKFCSFPDCGCDGARLCMAEEGPNRASVQLNIEKGSRS